jgi:2-iminobutanoate/2-iminopropanoate deaminase
MKKIIKSSKAPAPIGPYSQAVLNNSVLYVSGQIAINPETGELDNKDIVAETTRVMLNIKAILSEAGLVFENVVKCTIFVKDLNNFAAINNVYGEYFPVDPPARETVEVSRLPKDVNVEISCIATGFEV